MKKRFVVYYPRALVGNGGPTAAVWAWVRALQSVGQEVTILYDSQWKASQPLAVPNVPVVPISHRFNGRFRYPVNMSDQFTGDTILILHSAFSLANLVAASIAKSRGACYIFTPHGAYAREALRRKWLRKRIWLLIESSYLRKSLAIHAFVGTENDSIQKVAPNVEVINAPTPVQTQEPRQAAIEDRYIAWLGRYDIHIKGLDLLMRAYTQVPRELRIQVRLHGRDSTNSRKEVQELVKSLDLEKDIYVNGPIEGLEKNAFLANAFLFIMPSRTESFSIALSEALALDVPCLISDTIPIANKLRCAKACMITSIHPEKIADALTEILDGTRDLTELRPREYVCEHLSDRVVGESFVRQVDTLLERHRCD